MNQTNEPFTVNTQPAQPVANNASTMQADIAEIKELLKHELGRQKHHRIAKTLFYIIIITLVGSGYYYAYKIISTKVGEVMQIKNSLDDTSGDLKQWTQENVDELKDKLKDVF